MLISWSQVVKFCVCFAFLAQLTGCSHFHALKPSVLPFHSAQSQLAEAPANLARLILIRPKESLLPFPEKNPVLLYNGSEKIAEIPHGQFLRLDSAKLPQNLTIHWFDDENPNISRTINLKINLKPGEVQAIELSKTKGDLVAQLIDQEATSMKLPWYAEVSMPEDFSESYVSLEQEPAPF